MQHIRRMAPSRPTQAGQLRARDAFLLPGWISFVRVVLAAVFPFVVDDVAVAVALLAAAGASDVLDGWVARRRGEETAMGAVLDAVADKAFVASILVALVLRHRLGALDVVLLSTREIVEAPVLAWGLVRRAGVERERRANALGKITTVLQFAALLLVLLRRPHTVPMIGAAALGLVTGLTYAVRERAARPPAQ
jgi:CDP-diacylglycerol--glycerol-3-phosphate 3-phosphatidyltransferase/cardiolipin synthase